MLTSSFQQRFIDSWRNKDGLERKLLEGCCQSWRHLQLFVVFASVVHVHIVKRARGGKGSFVKELASALVVAQRFERGVQARFNGAEWNFHCLCNFSEAQAIDEAEQNGFAMFFG